MVDSVIQHAPRTFVSHRCFDTGRWDKTRQGSFASPEPMPWKVLKRGQFDRHQTDRGRGGSSCREVTYWDEDLLGYTCTR